MTLGIPRVHHKEKWFNDFLLDFLPQEDRSLDTKSPQDDQSQLVCSNRNLLWCSDFSNILKCHGHKNSFACVFWIMPMSTILKFLAT